MNLAPRPPPQQSTIEDMLAMVQHRGPDEFGIYADETVALGSARLSLVDLTGGQQPICSEDGRFWIVFNGEIFNHRELRGDLEARGCRYSSSTDTETVLHSYIQLGSDCLKRLNGDFAFAIWDGQKREIFLARDRVGVRPLFFKRDQTRLIFGSEIKAILAAPDVTTALDPVVLEQIFTFWAPLPSCCIFKGIEELPPAHYLRISSGSTVMESYWNYSFPGAFPSGALAGLHHERDCQEELERLLINATRIRLQADVPVGALVSGGLDSSLIAAIATEIRQKPLDIFSIAVEGAQFDESHYQQEVAAKIGGRHHGLVVQPDDIGRAFSEVVWHTEVPIMRTAPVPLFLLSKLVHDCGFKAVLTGEGADEFLGGYDIFKEAKIRRFWARAPESSIRPLLFKRLYPDIGGLSQTDISLTAAFFRGNLTAVDDPFYSHMVRWRNNRRACRLFSAQVKEVLARQQTAVFDQIRIPAGHGAWGGLERAQYLECSIFLSQYLLSAQGDRVSMAHSVEGRYPFLDTKLIEFCNGLPSKFKLRALIEKYLLKKVALKWLPPSIAWRRKHPFRAPIQRSFCGKGASGHMAELLGEERIRKSGWFDPIAVKNLVKRAAQEDALGETDAMALVGIISTELVQQFFVDQFKAHKPAFRAGSLKVCGTPRKLAPI